MNREKQVIILSRKEEEEFQRLQDMAQKACDGIVFGTPGATEKFEERMGKENNERRKHLWMKKFAPEDVKRK